MLPSDVDDEIPWHPDGSTSAMKRHAQALMPYLTVLAACEHDDAVADAVQAIGCVLGWPARTVAQVPLDAGTHILLMRIYASNSHREVRCGTLAVLAAWAATDHDTELIHNDTNLVPHLISLVATETDHLTLRVAYTLLKTLGYPNADPGPRFTRPTDAGGHHDPVVLRRERAGHVCNPARAAAPHGRHCYRRFRIPSLRRLGAVGRSRTRVMDGGRRTRGAMPSRQGHLTTWSTCCRRFARTKPAARNRIRPGGETATRSGRGTGWWTTGYGGIPAGRICRRVCISCCVRCNAGSAITKRRFFSFNPFGSAPISE
ncbi:hypothetical protein BC828DRAFT_148608 [Blastocladiella britannica]|nr:hypothetical protein BC828DRAFT_148608 [Blastocladiella britannica]